MRNNDEEGIKSLVDTIGFIVLGLINIFLLYCLRNEQSSQKFACRVASVFYAFLYLLFLIPILGILWWFCSLLISPILSPIMSDFFGFLEIPALLISPIINALAIPISAMTGQHVTDISSMLKVIIGGTIWTILVLALARVLFRIKPSNFVSPFIWFFKAIGTLTTKTLELMGKFALAIQEWKIVQEAREQRTAMRHSKRVQKEIIRQEREEQKNTYTQQ